MKTRSLCSVLFLTLLPSLLSTGCAGPLSVKTADSELPNGAIRRYTVIRSSDLVGPSVVQVERDDFYKGGDHENQVLVSAADTALVTGTLRYGSFGAIGGAFHQAVRGPDNHRVVGQQNNTDARQEFNAGDGAAAAHNGPTGSAAAGAPGGSIIFEDSDGGS